jgi:hypothetical protein
VGLRAQNERQKVYHLSVKPISRSTGRSAVAAAAYRSGTFLINARDGLAHDYTRRAGVLHTEIVVPPGAEWALDRSALWNAAEAAENRKNSQVGREWEIALPAELNEIARAALARKFATELAEDFGVAVDIAIHAPSTAPGADSRNFHAHLLSTTRIVTADGLGCKTRALDDRISGPIEIERMRSRWADCYNGALEAHGIARRIDHRSLAAQGSDRVPTVHLGPQASQMERRGVPSDRGNRARAISIGNSLRMTGIHRAVGRYQAKIGQTPPMSGRSKYAVLKPSSQNIRRGCRIELVAVGLYQSSLVRPAGPPTAKPLSGLRHMSSRALATLRRGLDLLLSPDQLRVVSAASPRPAVRRPDVRDPAAQRVASGEGVEEAAGLFRLVSDWLERVQSKPTVALRAEPIGRTSVATTEAPVAPQTVSTAPDVGAGVQPSSEPLVPNPSQRAASATNKIVSAKMHAAQVAMMSNRGIS